MVIGATIRNLNLEAVAGEESYVERVLNQKLTVDEFDILYEEADKIGVTDEFKRIMKEYPMPDGETPAGFEVQLELSADRVVRANLKRNISYGKNGIKRPTNLLFSADSANPYEIEPIAPLLANLTCNPGIIYDLFINNDVTK